MQVFVQRPSVDLFPGIRVTKDMVIDYENEKVKQTVNDLVFRSVTRVTGKSFESVNDTTIYLEEGDILIFEEEGRGYIKPVEPFVTIDEAMEDLANVKDLG
jgi:hypothetical protein